MKWQEIEIIRQCGILFRRCGSAIAIVIGIVRSDVVVVVVVVVVVLQLLSYNGDISEFVQHFNRSDVFHSFIIWYSALNRSMCVRIQLRCEQ